MDTTPQRKHKSNPYLTQYMLEYLETMRELWPVRLKILKAKRSGDMFKAQDEARAFAPIIERAKIPLNNAFLIRYRMRKLYNKDEQFRTEENRRCSEDFVYFINHWCYTSDPRNASLGFNTTQLPFVLWPMQEEFLTWMHQFYLTGGLWLAPKSRAIGLTWMMSAYYSWHWNFHTGFIGGFGSRDKDAVDKIGDPDTIFAKCRYIIYKLPHGMRPSSYKGKSIQDQSKDDCYLRIVNPDNESVIRGEGGENIGAGGRGSMYFVDEHALIEHPEKIDDSISYTTFCTGYGSTVRGMNNFGQKVHDNKIPKFECWFYRDPSRYEGWRGNHRPTREECPYLDHEIEEKGMLVVAQEILMDCNRSVEDAFIPAEWVQAAIDFDVPAEGDRQSGFDVSGGGENKSVYSFRIGPVLFMQKEFSYETMQENLECALHHAEEDKSDLFSYDADGLGKPVWGHIKWTERKIPFSLCGVMGNGSTSEKYLFAEGCHAKDKFYNRRAENCWNLRERFRKTFEHRKGVRIYDFQELISIPNDTKLIQQLSQPKQKYGGKIKIERKDEIIGRGVKSPDYFDSAVLAFADPDNSSLVVSEFNYKTDAGTILDFEFKPDDILRQSYVSMITTADMMTYILGCDWFPAADRPQLRVFCDFVIHSSEVKRIVQEVKEVMVDVVKPVREWVCNEEMVDGVENDKQSPWYLYRKEGVSIRKNYSHDYATSIMIVNQLFKNGIIKLHTRCERTMMQVMNWRIENGKPQGDLGFAMALCQLVTRLRTKKEIKIEHVSPNWTPKSPYKGAGHFAEKAPHDNSPAAQLSYMKLAERQCKA